MNFQVGGKRLIENIKKQLNTNSQKVDTLNETINKYECLKQKLSTFAHQLSYNQMIPIGPCAYMPGRVFNTNEITVCLGADWFAEVSAKTAGEIVDLRLKNNNKHLNKLKQETNQLETWLKSSEDCISPELMDIQEEYDPEREKQWREEHKLRVREYKKKQAEINKAGAQSIEDILKKEDDKDLVVDETEKAKEGLAKLQILENFRRETNQSQKNEKIEGKTEKEQKTNRPLKNVDCESKSQKKNYDSKTNISETNKERPKDIPITNQDSYEPETVPIINFQHSNFKSPEGSCCTNTNMPNKEHELMSPADIYHHYITSQLKELPTPSDEKTSKVNSAVNFEIIEHNLEDKQTTESSILTDVDNNNGIVNLHKPSLFKQRKSNR